MKAKNGNTANDTPDPIDRTELVRLVHQAAGDRCRPDGSRYSSLMFQDELRIVRASGHSHREVQLTALANHIVPERYARNQKSITSAEQIRLLESHVAVIGLGGLGGAVTEILARMGIGGLTLVDGDHFEDSNLNRQLLSSTEMLGRMKAEVAALRVGAVNPAVEVRVVKEFLTDENRDDILADADIGVDCLDTIPARFILEQGCRQAGIPMISAAIAGTSGQATVVFPDDPGLRRIYNSSVDAPRKGVEATLGTLPYAAIAMAAMECAEVIALAVGRPAQLRNKLLLADFTYHSLEIVDFS